MDEYRKHIGAYVVALNNRIRKEVELSANRNNIIGAQGRTLIYILVESKQRDLFQKDIEEEYNIRPSTASVLLKKMEQDGLITREPIPTDNRLKKIVPTKKAIAAQPGVIKDITVLENKLTDDIDPKQIEMFFNIVDKMIANLQ